MESKISVRLKTLRLSLKYTAKQVIAKLKKFGYDYKVQALYKWEEGSCNPNINVLYVLAKIYNCHISYLIDELDVEYRNLTPTEIYLLNRFRTDFLFKSIALQIIKLLNRNVKE